MEPTRHCLQRVAEVVILLECATSYANYFGRDNVIVIPFELLQRDEDCFCDALAVELGWNLVPSKRPPKAQR